MARQAGGFAFGRIAPDGMVAAFAQKNTALFAEMAFEVEAFHESTLTGSRIQPESRSCSRASSRFVSKIKANASFKLARASASVAP